MSDVFAFYQFFLSSSLRFSHHSNSTKCFFRPIMSPTAHFSSKNSIKAQLQRSAEQQCDTYTPPSSSLITYTFLRLLSSLMFSLFDACIEALIKLIICDLDSVMCNNNHVFEKRAPLMTDEE